MEQQPQALLLEDSIERDNADNSTKIEVFAREGYLTSQCSQKSGLFKSNYKRLYLFILLIVTSIVFVITLYAYMKSKGKNHLIQNNYETLKELDMNNGQYDSVLKSSELKHMLYPHDIDKDQQYNPRKYKFSPPKDIGHMNVYIRKSGRGGYGKGMDQYRFPVAQYNRNQFPFRGPFLSFSPRIPLFVERFTLQTIIYSPSGIYILPPLVNFYGKRFSVAELIAAGYASLVSNGGPVNTLNIANMYRPIPLIGPSIPYINPLTGGFNGGLRVNYNGHKLRKLPEKLVNDFNYDLDEDDDYRQESKYSENKYRNPYYYNRQAASRTRTPTTTQGLSLNVTQQRNTTRVVGGYWPNFVPSPIRIRDINLNYTLIYLFHAQPVGGPPGTTGAIYFTPPDDGRGARTHFVEDIQYARNVQNRAIILSVGGAENGMSFPNREKSQTFVNSVIDLYNQLGGFDGLDWNTFEAEQVPDTEEMIWISKQLKSLYPGFLITAPPAPWNPRDVTFCQAMVQAGAMDYAAPQYYDGPGLANQSYIVNRTDYWVSLLGETHVVVGFGVNPNQTNYMTIDEAVSTWKEIKSRHPTIRGAFDWEVRNDEAQGWVFANQVGPLVTGDT